MAAPRRGSGTRFVLLGDPYQRQQDEAEFLEAVRVSAPEVLRSLRDEVLPAYRRARPSTEGSGRRRAFMTSEPERFRKVVSGFLQGVDAPWTAAAMDVRNQLVSWAARFNLSTDWVRRRAAATLEWWSTIPAGKAKAAFIADPHWSPGGTPGTHVAPIDSWQRDNGAPDDPPPRWDPFLDPEGTYRAEVERYISHRKALARQVGGVLDHLPSGWKWLARFQVLRESATRIAKTDGVKRDRRNIERTIKALASRIALPLRERLKAGRPRVASVSPK